MKPTHFLLPAALVAGFVAGVGAVADPAVAVAPVLTPMQGQVLHALAMPIVLPAVLPPGMKLTQVVTHVPSEARGPGIGPRYGAIYEGGGKAFGVESTPGGIGDLPTEPRSYFTPAGLGVGKTGLHFQDKTWLSAWIEYRGQFYRFVGAGYAHSNLSEDVIADGELDAAWAGRVAASLRPVKP